MRMVRNESWGGFEHTLASGVEAVQGEMACIDTSTGLLTVGAVGGDLLFVGHFKETVTGDGTRKVRVRFLAEKHLTWFDNDTAGTPVAADDIGSECFILNPRTVSADGTGRSAIGRVWAVHGTHGVLVEGKA